MKRFVLSAVCVALLPGCSASLGMRVGNVGAPATQPSVGPGGSFSSSAVDARIGDGSTLGAIIGIGVLSALFGGDEAGVPEPDAARRVHEQDCSKALEVPEANLRCR